MLIQLILISLAIQILLFIPAFLVKTDKLTDFSYSLGFIALSSWVFLKGDKNILHTILFMMIILWSFRLGAFLVLRIRKAGKDKRFDQIRINFWKFLQFWIFQGVVIPFILLPSVYFFAKNPTLNPCLFVGLVIWLSGIVIEAISDIQKYNFKDNPKNNDKWISTGLWKYSRHPNYLGEIMCWLGIYIFTFNSLAGAEKIYGLVSPIIIATLLLFISGIPILEKKADEKWGKDKDYQNYKRKTAVLIPYIY